MKWRIFIWTWLQGKHKLLPHKPVENSRHLKYHVITNFIINALCPNITKVALLVSTLKISFNFRSFLVPLNSWNYSNYLSAGIWWSTWNTHALQYLLQPYPYPKHHPDAAQVELNIPAAEYHLSLSESHLGEKTQCLFSCITLLAVQNYQLTDVTGLNPWSPSSQVDCSHIEAFQISSGV